MTSSSRRSRRTTCCRTCRGNYLIPVFYGEGRCEGSRALLLSHVDGITASRLVDIDQADFRQLLRQTFSAFPPYNIMPGNLKLDNFILSEQRIVALDLEDFDLDGDPGGLGG